MSISELKKYSVIPDDVSHRLTEFDLRILECGEITTDTNDTHGEKFSHLFRINYVVSGMSSYRYEDLTIDLEPGSVVFLEPNVTLRVDEGEPIHLLFINFDIYAVDKRREFLDLMNSLFPYRHIHDRDDEIKQRMLLINELAVKNETGAGLEIQNVFENLVLRIIRQSGMHYQDFVFRPYTRADDIFNDAVKYINEHMGENFRVRDIAQAMSISSNYLYKIFISHTGRSPSDFLTNLKVDISKTYLANPDTQIKLIADSLGFDSPSHFSQVFRRVAGITPAAYRKKAVAEVKKKIEKDALTHNEK